MSFKASTRSDKLMKLTVDFGDHERSILAGIKRERENPREIRGRAGLRVRAVGEPTLRQGLEHVHELGQLLLPLLPAELEAPQPPPAPSP